MNPRRLFRMKQLFKDKAKRLLEMLSADVMSKDFALLELLREYEADLAKAESAGYEAGEAVGYQAGTDECDECDDDMDCIEAGFVEYDELLSKESELYAWRCWAASVLNVPVAFIETPEDAERMMS